MNGYNPDSWIDILGLVILSLAGVAGAVIPAWLLKKQKQKKSDTQVEGVSSSQVLRKLVEMDAEIDNVLTELTQMRRASTHFGAAMADMAVEQLRSGSHESEERIKELIRAVHRDVKECAKQVGPGAP